MGLSIKSKLKDIMKNEAAVEAYEEFMPGFRKSPNLKLAQGMSLEKIIAMTLDSVDTRLGNNL